MTILWIKSSGTAVRRATVSTKTTWFPTALSNASSLGTKTWCHVSISEQLPTPVANVRHHTNNKL